MSGPLEGYRVVELAEGIAGPYCALELADGGADVVKVGRIEGDRTRGWGAASIGTLGAAFEHLNRNKRGLALDTDSETGVEILRRLVQHADIVVADAGWSHQPGLQFESLGELNQNLVYCRLSFFGDEGPWADRAPHGELVAQLSAETTGSLGRVGEPPVRMATAMGSMYAAIYAVQGICAALLARDDAGGQRLDVSLFGSLLAMRSTLWTALSNPDEWWGFHLESYVKPPDYGYRCKDGFIFMSFARLSQEQRDRLYGDLKMDDWVRDEPQWEVFATDGGGGTGRHSHVVKHIWERALANFTTEEAMEIVRRNGGWAFPKNDYERLANAPQVEHVGMIQSVEGLDGGSVRMQMPPWDFSATPADVRRPAPRLGQHGIEVLSELDFEGEEIERLRSAGTLP